MPTGVVKWFNPANGYGFIQPDGGGKDVFVLMNALERAGMHSLSEGQRVSFDTEVSQLTGKPAAINIRPAE
jgi:cold shock protein